ncbi:MAG: glycerophosphodiester phosphodiesterase family protein [Candidatus Hermodarchaeota archaeon]
MQPHHKFSFSESQGKRWIGLFSILFINLAVFITIILFGYALWSDINNFITNAIGIEINWILLILGLSVLVILYSISLLVIHTRELLLTGRTDPHIANKILPFPILVIWNAMIVLLILEAGEYMVEIYSSFEHFSPLIFLGAIIILLLILSLLIPKLRELWRQTSGQAMNPRIKVALILVGCVVMYSVVFSLPYVLLPANIISGDLPAKPQIVAHRGGSHLAPENTLAAGEFANDLGVLGWEVDVQISYDGVPFLLHDETLKRTTNVETIFPNRVNGPGSSFNISDLRQLDAGSWFVDTDPYGTIGTGIVTSERAENYRNLKIPTLEEVLNLTRDTGLILDVDFKKPSDNHPYYAQYYNICLELILEANINSQIWIVSGPRSLLDTISELYPDMRTGLPVGANNAPSVEELQVIGYDFINTHHGLTNDQFRAYTSAGIAVEAWTVNTIIRFSQLWCLGVKYIKTDAPHLFINLTQPLWYIQINDYNIAWIAIEISGLVLVLGFQYWRQKKNTSKG